MSVQLKCLHQIVPCCQPFFSRRPRALCLFFFFEHFILSVMLPQLSASLPGRKAPLVAGLLRFPSSEISGGQGKRSRQCVHVSCTLAAHELHISTAQSICEQW